MQRIASDRRAILFGAAALAMGCGAAAWAQTPLTDEPGLHDLTPDFWRFYDANPSASADPGVRSQALVDQVFAPSAELYSRAGFGVGKLHGTIDQDAVAAWLTIFDPLAATARRVSESFPSAWRTHVTRFATAFPQAHRDVRAYMLVSLCAFDLEDRSSHGQACLFAGIDGVAKLDGPSADIGVLLDQHAFRRYQAQVNPSLWPRTPSPLWACVWREGLAAYASGKLAPDLGRATVLMDSALSDLPQSQVRRLAADLVPALETTDASHRARFMSADAQGDTPARGGYLLGYLLAEHAGRSLSPDALARLPAPRAHLFVKHQLSLIAHG